MLNLNLRMFGKSSIEKLCDEADEEIQYTADLWKLEQHYAQFLFAYDEMMEGHSKYEELIAQHLAPSIPCAAYTVDKFSVYKKNLGKESFPIPLEKVPQYNGLHRNIADPWRIKGQVYAIKSPHYKILDKYKQNGLHFLRKRVKLVIPHTRLEYVRELTIGGEASSVKIESSTFTLRAFMYVGVPEYWYTQLDAGCLFSPVKTYTHTHSYLKNFYYFTEKDFFG